ncbi:methylmalonyl Co-A mutase-associated GTPase MeaB [Segetibacter sp. 3557_3]|uniref:methylmalonyl Co-A mutase-associated GTPase MeaB n=1 Tax=Segetibacter sp. 3557_3 TaxID=2547429 RepID=UPI0010591542|nr:methylmalonyl Co-A mutase-associated GTPase MeaB [Segetibacter sp. 3557_3]TDH20884.1 methylmalonyl Co-A mutase-associated GTPase MeaB [Segetibacter sp. 3557_3]
MWQTLLSKLVTGDIKALARTISLVENQYEGYFNMLQQLPASNTPITGITGPPGAGKSTLVDGLIGTLVDAGKNVAVVCVDPSSPFNLGALLGDRIRMSGWYNHPNVYIRSLATRGSLGGLHPHIIEITDVLKAAPFDQIIVETVGVGQSEIEIAGLADTTVVVLVPEAGDEIQTMKAGLMEIGDIFVVNKADREGADQFVKNLRGMLAPLNHAQEYQIPVVKTIADKRTGIAELSQHLLLHPGLQRSSEKYYHLLTQKALLLIQQQRMKDVDRQAVFNAIKNKAGEHAFNLYNLVQTFL